MKQQIPISELEIKAVAVIKQIEYLNIASITPDGMPWGTPVYTVYDKELNFHWLSWKENQHSLNVAHNPNVFVTLYDSTVPCSTGFGVYLQGKVKPVMNPVHLAKCLLTFYNRRNRQPRDVKEFLTSYPRRLYMFTPERIWVNGDGEINGNYIDVRTELDLDNLRRLLNK
jgi:hypothetical protein